MAVNDNPSRITYTNSAGVSIFPWNFNIFETSDIVAYKNKITLIEGVDYTVSGVGAGGTITTTTPLISTDVLILQRRVPFNQTNDFVTGGEFTGDAIDDALDRLTVQNQEARDLINDLGVQYNESELIADKDKVLSILTAGQMWQMNSDETAIQSVSLEESSGFSSLRSELANDNALTDGARLVGYSAQSIDSTVKKQLDVCSEGLGVSFTDFGASGDGATDCTAAFNSFVASDVDTLYMPKGNFLFKSRPNQINRKFNIFGAGVGQSVIELDYTESLTNSNGLITLGPQSSESRIEDLQFHAASHTGGSAIEIGSDAINKPDYIFLKNILIGGAGQWHFNVFIDGNANANAMEFINLDNVIGYTGTITAGLFVRKVKYSRFSGFFIGAGSTQSVVVDGTAGLSTNLEFDLMASDRLSLKGISNSTIRLNSCTTLTTDNTADYITVIGKVLTVTGEWTNSIVLDSIHFDANLSATSGHQKLPSGLIIQWGTVSTNNTGYTAILDIPFPNANFGIFGGTTEGGYVVYEDVAGRTLSVVRVYNNHTSVIPTRFIVLGY